MPSALAVSVVMVLALGNAQGEGRADGRRLEAGNGAPYATANEALATVRPGDTVLLRHGTHPGPLIVRVAGITITGTRAAVVDGGRRGTVITVAADSVTLEGFVVRASGRSLDRDDAAV